MATQLQIRRGTTAQMNAFTGAEGELAVNTSTDTVHVHDGATAGGFALAKADGSNIATYAGSFTTLAASGAVTLSSSLAVTGALTVDTNTLVVDATNNRVGIGTSSPQSIVHIDQGASDAQLTLETHAAGDSKIVFSQGQTAGNWAVGYDDGGGVTENSLSFAYKADGYPSLSGQNKMILTPAGNVGIGRTAIDERVHIQDGNNEIRFKASNASGGYATFGLDSALTSDGRITWTNALIFGDSGSERLRIAANGSISIPNQNAINELSFTGTEFTNVLSATTSGFQLGTTGAGYLSFLTNNTERIRLTSAGALELTGDSGAGQTFLNFTANSNTLKAQISGAKAGSNGGTLSFSTNNSSGTLTEAMGISAAGIVTKPYQPAFKAGRNTDYTPSQNTAIVFNDDSSAQHFNIGGHYSTSSGRFTCPVAGRYFFHTVVIYGPTLTSGQNMADAFRILKNGALVAYSHRRAEYVPGTTGSSGYYVDHATVVLDCAQYQYVEVNSIAFPVHGNTHYTYFTGYLIG